jgi:hypothetical protein
LAMLQLQPPTYAMLVRLAWSCEFLTMMGCVHLYCRAMMGQAALAIRFRGGRRSWS